MALLQAEDVQFLTENFADLATPVTLTVVAKERSRLILPGAEPEEPGDASGEVKEIVTEVAATSPHVTVAERAPAGDELAPAIEFGAAHVKGKLRYVGLPAGYEMSTLIGAILDLGTGESPLPPPIAERMAQLPKDVHIQVFVTPGCPHCPGAARAALQLAIGSDKIRAEVIEIQEFPELARKYQVRGVPMTILNDGETLMGAVPPMQLIDAVERAARDE